MRIELTTPKFQTKLSMLFESSGVRLHWKLMYVCSSLTPRPHSSLHIAWVWGQSSTTLLPNTQLWSILSIMPAAFSSYFPQQLQSTAATSLVPRLSCVGGEPGNETVTATSNLGEKMGRKCCTPQYRLDLGHHLNGHHTTNGFCSFSQCSIVPSNRHLQHRLSCYLY